MMSNFSKLKNFLDERLVAECLWFVQLPDILHWVARECRLEGKQGEKYKQKSGTNTERGQPGGSRFLISTMPRSPVTCIWSFCRQFGKIFKLTIQVFSCYFCFHFNDILTELLGVFDDGWFSQKSRLGDFARIGAGEESLKSRWWFGQIWFSECWVQPAWYFWFFCYCTNKVWETHVCMSAWITMMKNRMQKQLYAASHRLGNCKPNEARIIFTKVCKMSKDLPLKS